MNERRIKKLEKVGMAEVQRVLPKELAKNKNGKAFFIHLSETQKMISKAIVGRKKKEDVINEVLDEIIKELEVPGYEVKPSTNHIFDYGLYFEPVFRDPAASYIADKQASKKSNIIEVDFKRKKVR